jgi:hypothetical protein
MISTIAKTKLLYNAFLLLLFTNLSAQQNISFSWENQHAFHITDDNTMIATDTLLLLPNKYLFTQKLLWGKKGAMRIFGSFKLSAEEREREMNARNTMISIHQYLGYATLTGMAFECVTGVFLYNGHKNLDAIHGDVGCLIDITYLTAAGLALFAPPPMSDRERGWNLLKAHKIFSLLSFSSLIATDVLGGLSKNNSHMKPYHVAAACTAFGTFLISATIVKF